MVHGRPLVSRHVLMRLRAHHMLTAFTFLVAASLVNWSKSMALMRL